MSARATGAGGGQPSTAPLGSDVAPTAAFRAPLRDGPSAALGGSLRTGLVFSWRTEGLGLVDTQLIASCAQVGVRAVRGTEDLCSVILNP